MQEQMCSGCFLPALSSALEPRGDTSLCNSVITLAQLATGAFQHWLGCWARGSQTPASKQVSGQFREGVFSVHGGPGLSLHPQLLHTHTPPPLFTVSPTRPSLEQGSHYTWPRWWTMPSRHHLYTEDLLSPS